MVSRKLLLLALALGVASSARADSTEAAEPEPSPVALLFGKRCGSCHTIGAGDRTGPDLLGVHSRRDPAWIKGFIRAPGAAIDRGDPVATELFARFKNVKMPDQQLSDQEVGEVLAYLTDCASKGGCKVALGKVRPASEATAEDIAQGRLLFEGRRRLERGGPACISCHNVRGVGIVGGGTLARDLTFAYARLGDVALSAGLSDPAFPLMRGIFADRPLNQTEAFQIKAYLYDASRDGAPPRGDHNFLYLGVLGTFFTLGLIGMVWSGRMHGIRQALVKGDQP